MTPEERVKVDAAIAAHRERRGALLPLLHAIRRDLGRVPPESVPIVAEALNLSRADVHGVVTFYHDFRSHSASGASVRLCRAEACQARGVDATAAALDRAGMAHESVYCLGLCSVGPAALVDGAPVARVRGPNDLCRPATLDCSGSAVGGLRVFVSGDTASVALGADAVATALASAGATVVRTGGRGLSRIEPLVEIETSGGRIGYGPIAPGEVRSVLDGTHPARLGRVEELPFFAQQRRFTFARCGVTDPLSLDDYAEHGGWRGLDAARAMRPVEVVEAVKRSGLRGRGGAGFPTGIKWDTVRLADSLEKFVVCNADEGDSGTFADRMLMEGDPFCLIEGMAIAGHATGAQHGFVYIRSEYPLAIDVMERAIALAADRIAPFTLEVRVGAGAYVCGEETALLESIEGKRGQVRAKPPLPALSGLWGKPTVINNVLSLAAIPFILSEGPEAYAVVGFGRSRGTMPIQLSGDVRNGGLFEVGFGLTLDQLVHEIGGGTESGRPVRCVQVGGPLGAYIPPSQFHLSFDYEAFAAAGGLIGHAGVTIFNDRVDMKRMARFAMEFCAAESCGKCTPCRIGSTRGVEVMDAIIAGERVAENVELLRDLCDTMRFGSLCALGGFAPYPVLSALDHFPEDFGPVAQGASGMEMAK